MLPHLKYVEDVFQMLIVAKTQDETPNIPKPNIEFKGRPLSSQTLTEILMHEMLYIIEVFPLHNMDDVCRGVSELAKKYRVWHSNLQF